MRYIFYTLLCLAIPLLSMPSFAYAISQKDLAVATRTLGFVKGVPKGAVAFGIVYNPHNATSKTEATNLYAMATSKPKFGKYTLQPKLIPVGALTNSKVSFAYVTKGMSGNFNTIHSIASKKKILTFSTDFSCVQKKKCVMGVSAEPNVKIEVSKSASENAGISFSSALRMMINEVE